jgi:hypothetical protein
MKVPEVSVRPTVEVQARQINGCLNRHASARYGLEKPS